MMFGLNSFFERHRVTCMKRLSDTPTANRRSQTLRLAAAPPPRLHTPNNQCMRGWPLQASVVTDQRQAGRQETDHSREEHRPNPSLEEARAEQEALLSERRASNSSATTSQAPGDPRGEGSRLQEVDGPVEMCLTVTLPAEGSYAAAAAALQRELGRRQEASHMSGVLRLEVPLPPGVSASQWLRGQGAASRGLTSVYFSPRRSSAPTTPGILAAGEAAEGIDAVAGVGAAWQWQGSAGGGLDEAAVQKMQAFLSPKSPRVRVLGGARFDSQGAPSPEWQGFGSYFFMLPRLELLEAGSCNLLACTLAWNPNGGNTHGGFGSFQAAAQDARVALDLMRPPALAASPAIQIRREGTAHLPEEPGWHKMMEPVHDKLQECGVEGLEEPSLSRVDPQQAFREFEANGQGGLDALLANLDGSDQAATNLEEGELTKVVLARRTNIAFRGHLDALALLETLQERDPRAFQLLLQLPSGATFLGSTPELLYQRSGRSVASEAVAGTRPRGPPGEVEKDFWLAFDLLRTPKDHAEFTIVRDWVRDALKSVCSDVTVDTEKSVLKQGVVQHLYGRLSGQLHPHCNDSHLLAALHPTPAVCGRPREAAKAQVSECEPFDRGFYAGPFGWISGSASGFAVAIRSALVHPQHSLPSGEQVAASSNGALDCQAVASTGFESQASGQGVEEATGAGQRLVSLYAGVGIVRGSDAHSEWQELDLKVRQFDSLLRQPAALRELGNVNLVWARLMVEELCRLGITTFCIAPGSRSSVLTVAAAMQPTARIVPCIDERSLAFFALGCGRATQRPAVVITSSGTAVANLFPAVVEASISGVPLLLLTADRPGELRDTGANQTIDQVKLFGGYTRWAADVPPPDTSTPTRTVLTTVDAAARHCQGPQPGPVHLNCQFREPLGPGAAPWPANVLQGLERWEQSQHPFTQPHSLQISGAGLPTSGFWDLISRLRACRKGLVVVGEQLDPVDSLACLRIASHLKWPLAADALSGLSVGAMRQEGVQVVSHLDCLLLDREAWPALRPDVVLQIGGRITSKRARQFLEWATIGEGGAEWMFLGATPDRHDAAHCISSHIQMTPATFAGMLSQVDSPPSTIRLDMSVELWTGVRTPEHGSLLFSKGCVRRAELDRMLDNVHASLAVLQTLQWKYSDDKLNSMMVCRRQKIFGKRTEILENVANSSPSLHEEGVED